MMSSDEVVKRFKAYMRGENVFNEPAPFYEQIALERIKEQLAKGCPECGGPTTYDRSYPPEPYVCDDCDEFSEKNWLKSVNEYEEKYKTAAELLAKQVVSYWECSEQAIANAFHERFMEYTKKPLPDNLLQAVETILGVDQ